jgi:hypothetical protein
MIINAFFLYAICCRFFGVEAIGNVASDDTYVWAFFTAVLPITLFFLSIRLDTVIQEDGIHVLFFPIQWKLKAYPWEEIQECYVRTYRPLTEYGGWGYRIGLFESGGALNVSGKEGIQLELKNGKRLLIGTQRPEDAKEALQKLESAPG